MNIRFSVTSTRRSRRLSTSSRTPGSSYGYRGVAKRSVFILDRKGILRYRWVTDVPGEEPPYDEVVETLRKMGH